MNKLTSTLLITPLILTLFACDDNATETSKSQLEDVKKSGAEVIEVVQENTPDKVTDSVDELWEKSKKSSDELWQESKKVSEQLWVQGKESSSEIWDDTQQTSKEVWLDVKEDTQQILLDSQHKYDQLIQQYDLFNEEQQTEDEI